MKKRTVPLEGSVFLVPIYPETFAVGVLVRADGQGRAYGLFFGPPINDPACVSVDSLRQESAVLRCKFGDFGLVTARWPVIGRIPKWEQNRWPLPLFARRHDEPTLRYVSDYDDALDLRSEKVLPLSESEFLPEDAQFGSAVVEAKLKKLLAH